MALLFLAACTAPATLPVDATPPAHSGVRPATTGGATGSPSTTGGSGTPGGTGSPAAHSATAHSAAPPSPRDRLLLSYLGYLQQDPTHRQTNGLRGADLTDVCELWDALDPSSRDTFLTVTARLAGSTLARDGTSMLDHVTTVYRVVGGRGASAGDPGSCGGGEFNRLMMSMDDELHDALVDAHRHRGAAGAYGGPDLADIPADGSWRDSHDLAGPHDPFTQSDETEDGAPRGQVQYFADPTSVVAGQPLGRQDLEGLVDPYALEMDQDYDCAHDSNPRCAYTFYGPSCLPEPRELGTALYTQSYGSYDPGWRPSGC